MKKLLAFLLTFTLEVHVYAKAQEEPRNCLQTQNTCAVGNDDERGFEMKVGEATLTLDKDTAVIRTSPNEIRVVKGTVWVKGELTISSEFGSVKGADFWATKTSTELFASATVTPIEIAPRGSHETLEVAPGLQNMLGQIGFNGQAATGLPMPIPFKDFVMRWGRLYRGDKKEFETQVDSFHAKWGEATEESALINKAVYERKLASDEESARLAAEKKTKAQSEDHALRDLFRRRNGL